MVNIEDKKQRALTASSVLVGYAQSCPTSFDSLTKRDSEMLSKWFGVLLAHANRCGDLIDSVYTDEDS
jgi:hypothetical protein